MISSKSATSPASTRASTVASSHPSRSAARRVSWKRWACLSATEALAACLFGLLARGGWRSPERMFLVITCAAGFGAALVLHRFSYSEFYFQYVVMLVLVLGANGKVGQATVQLASAAGARVFGVARTQEPYRGHASSAVAMLASSASRRCCESRSCASRSVSPPKTEGWHG